MYCQHVYDLLKIFGRRKGIASLRTVPGFQPTVHENLFDQQAIGMGGKPDHMKLPAYRGPFCRVLNRSYRATA